jgi:uncharacterized coiled-coil DUF342 family protein
MRRKREEEEDVYEALRAHLMDRDEEVKKLREEEVVLNKELEENHKKLAEMQQAMQPLRAREQVLFSKLRDIEGKLETRGYELTSEKLSM